MSTQTKRRWYAFLGLFLAAILPFLMYQIVKSLSDDKVQIPEYLHPIGVDTIVTEEKKKVDTLYHTVGDFTLTDQMGQDFNLYRDTKDKVVVAHLFFCNCRTICPKLTQHAENLQYAYRKRDSLLRILSITVDPANDSVAALRAYAQKRHANHDMWYFLTGDKKEIYRIAREELFLDSSDGDGGDDDFVHSEYFVLLDFNKHIRGYYNGLDSMELKRLKDDIALIPLEKDPKP